MDLPCSPSSQIKEKPSRPKFLTDSGSFRAIAGSGRKAKFLPLILCRNRINKEKKKKKGEKEESSNIALRKTRNYFVIILSY